MTNFVPTTPREIEVFDAWRRVNEIACSTEDTAEIRSVVASAGVEPGAHIGTPPEDFSSLMVAEWVLGNWADMIDQGSPWLNQARNISLHQFEKLTGEPDPDWTVGDSEMFRTEVDTILTQRSDDTVVVVVSDKEPS